MQTTSNLTARSLAIATFNSLPRDPDYWTSIEVRRALTCRGIFKRYAIIPYLNRVNAALQSWKKSYTIYNSRLGARSAS